VSTLGQKRVKPSAYFRPIAQTISHNPATINSIQAIGPPEPMMFVIELVYKADLKEIDAHMSAHVKFLKKYYADGTFLVSGRKIPREGGIILAAGKTRQQIEALLQDDPFHKHGLADFRVIEFRASQRADDMPKRIEA
jgi:uncharacterized protein YciI